MFKLFIMLIWLIIPLEVFAVTIQFESVPEGTETYCMGNLVYQNDRGIQPRIMYVPYNVKVTKSTPAIFEPSPSLGIYDFSSGFAPSCTGYTVYPDNGFSGLEEAKTIVYKLTPQQKSVR